MRQLRQLRLLSRQKTPLLLQPLSMRVWKGHRLHNTVYLAVRALAAVQSRVGIGALTHLVPRTEESVAETFEASLRSTVEPGASIVVRARGMPLRADEISGYSGVAEPTGPGASFKFVARRRTQ